MLAQSAKIPGFRKIECKILNCNSYYDELGNDKIAFDVYAYTQGGEYINMGNSSLLFSFRPDCMGDFQVRYNENQMSGYAVINNVILNKILFIQYYANEGGWILDTSRRGEWLFSVTATLKHRENPYLIWNERDSAIVDQNLLFPVLNKFSGKFEFVTK